MVDPNELRPIVSSVVRFDIRAKRLLQSKRILPVAIGVPALLSLIWGGGYMFTSKFSHQRKPAKVHLAMLSFNSVQNVRTELVHSVMASKY